MLDESRPIGDFRTLAAERESRNRVESRRLEEGVNAVDVGRRRRERDKDRHIGPKRLRQPDRVVGRFAADVDVLAEHGELLGQIAVALIDRVEAVARANTAFRPGVEGMRAAAADRDVVACALVDQRLAQALEVGGDVVDRGPRLRTDFDHALGDLEFHVAELAVVLQATEQVGRAARQVVVALREELQLQFDAQRQRVAFREFQRRLAHMIPPLALSLATVSPERTRAKRHNAGPAISISAAAKSGNVSAERPISG